MESADNRSYITGLDVLRLLAAISVIAIHSFMEYDRFCDAYVVRILTRWAVPFFFMVTGYFMKDDSRGFGRFWFRILFQYLIWTIVYALLGNHNIWNIKSFLSALRSGIITPFWYFPSVLLCTLFVFALTRFVKDRRILPGICFLMFLMAMMGHTFTNISLFDFWNNGPVMSIHHRIIGEATTRDGLFWGSLFIAIGYVIRHNLEFIDRIRVFGRTGVAALVTLLVPALILYSAEIALIVYFDTGGCDITFFSVPVVTLMFLIARCGSLREETGKFIRKVSTYIFLVHFFFLELYMRQYSGLPLFLVTLLTTAAVSMLICVIVQKISSKINTRDIP